MSRLSEATCDLTWAVGSRNSGRNSCHTETAAPSAGNERRLLASGSRIDGSSSVGSLGEPLGTSPSRTEGSAASSPERTLALSSAPTVPRKPTPTSVAASLSPAPLLGPIPSCALPASTLGAFAAPSVCGPTASCTESEHGASPAPPSCKRSDVVSSSRPVESAGPTLCSPLPSSASEPPTDAGGLASPVPWDGSAGAISSGAGAVVWRSAWASDARNPTQSSIASCTTPSRCCTQSLICQHRWGEYQKL